jgi:hypothetical protein
MKNIKKTIELILNRLFPLDNTPSKVSVFMQRSWLETVSSDLYVKDYMWSKK